MSAMSPMGTRTVVTTSSQTGTRSDVANVCWIEVSVSENSRRKP